MFEISGVFVPSPEAEIARPEFLEKLAFFQVIDDLIECRARGEPIFVAFGQTFQIAFKAAQAFAGLRAVVFRLAGVLRAPGRQQNQDRALEVAL